MAEKKLQLEILTPERMFFSEGVDSVTINTPTGEMGIMYNTLPLVTALESGIIKIYSGKKIIEAVNGQGFAEVTGEKATILAQSCLWPHEVNYQAIDDEILKMQDLLKKKQSYQEYRMTKAQLQMQFAKLRIKSHTGD